MLLNDALDLAACSLVSESWSSAARLSVSSHRRRPFVINFDRSKLRSRDELLPKDSLLSRFGYCLAPFMRHLSLVVVSSRSSAADFCPRPSLFLNNLEQAVLSMSMLLEKMSEPTTNSMPLTDLSVQVCDRLAPNAFIPEELQQRLSEALVGVLGRCQLVRLDLGASGLRLNRVLIEKIGARCHDQLLELDIGCRGSPHLTHEHADRLLQCCTRLRSLILSADLISYSFIERLRVRNELTTLHLVVFDGFSSSLSRHANSWEQLQLRFPPIFLSLTVHEGQVLSDILVPHLPLRKLTIRLREALSEQTARILTQNFRHTLESLVLSGGVAKDILSEDEQLVLGGRLVELARSCEKLSHIQLKIPVKRATTDRLHSILTARQQPGVRTTDD